MGRRRRLVSIGRQLELFKNLPRKKSKNKMVKKSRKERKLIFRKKGKRISELIWSK